MPRALIPLAAGCEELEAVTLIDVLRRAGIDVVSAALDDPNVRCLNNTVLVADTTLDAVLDESFDIIILPGGLPGGAEYLNADPRIHAIIKRQNEQQGLIGAICAAPQVLQTAGLLEGKKATAYPGVLEQATGNKVEKDGNIITSRGPGTAMDFALEIIAMLVNQNRRAEIENELTLT